MDSLVGYGSDDEVESDRYGQQTVGGAGMRRREDDTNYDSVNMDMSEDSQAESEPELPPADGGPPPPPPQHDTHHTNDGGDSDRSRDRDGYRARDGDRPRDRDGDRQRDRDHDWRRDASRRDDRPYRSDRSERSERRSHDGPRRGLLGDRPDDRPARLDAKYGEAARSHDARDAVSPRFVDRERGDRRERDRERDRSRDRDSDRTRDRDGDRYRDRERDNRSRHSEDRRSGRVGRSERSRSRGAAFPPPPASDRHSPGGDYRPSYKVNRKLEVMEKMGLQIKTPDGSMATARELRAAAGGAGGGAAGGGALGASGARVLQQVQRRKLLWAHKGGADEAAKWSGTRFAQDSDGRQVSKFMRLMGIKDPAALESAGGAEGGAGAAGADPTRKQEELFQAMQAQYDVARATTHTMRGVGLGFTRNHF